MQGFRFSKDEYRRVYKRLMPSSKVLSAQLSVTRVADNETCALNVFGMPIRCPEYRSSPEHLQQHLISQWKRDRPEIIAVQLDPMPYMHMARSYAINNMPTIAN